MEFNNLLDFDFDVPKRLIALEPTNPRSNSKLLVYSDGNIVDTKFNLLFEYLRPGDRLIFNDTKVLHAKLFGQRTRLNNFGTGHAKIETLLIEKISANKWVCFCKPLKKINIFDQIVFSESLNAQVVSKAEGQCVLQFSKSGISLDREISYLGQLPLPPYITKNRGYRESDNTNYQSIFAKCLGAIASPTASLHFEQNILDKLKERGVNFSFITLHVGVGTFLPVKSQNISHHRMHSESGKISSKTAREINKTKLDGGRIIPVGTTALRLIETAAMNDNLVSNFKGKTDIFIRPGYQFKITDGLITNFHFPKSTLLMLISAFVGNNERKRIYNHALKKHYRFFSYGDSSLLLPRT